MTRALLSSLEGCAIRGVTAGDGHDWVQRTIVVENVRDDQTAGQPGARETGEQVTGIVLYLRRRRALTAAVFDVCAWVAVFGLSAWLRVDLVSADVPWATVLTLGMATGLLYVALAKPTKLHQGRARTGSLEEMLLLGTCVMGAGAVSFVLNFQFEWIPRSVPAQLGRGCVGRDRLGARRLAAAAGVRQ